MARDVAKLYVPILTQLESWVLPVNHDYCPWIPLFQSSPSSKAGCYEAYTGQSLTDARFVPILTQLESWVLLKAVIDDGRARIVPILTQLESWVLLYQPN